MRVRRMGERIIDCMGGHTWARHAVNVCTLFVVFVIAFCLCLVLTASLPMILYKGLSHLSGSSGFFVTMWYVLSFSSLLTSFSIAFRSHSPILTLDPAASLSWTTVTSIIQPWSIN